MEENVSLEKLKKLLETELPSYLYHYTNRDSFIGIMKNKEFWVSHIRFMNDIEEERLAENELLNLLSIPKNKIPSIDMEILKNETIESIKNEMSKREIFILSLSESPDELNMWRGYGKNTPAYSIQIDCDKMIEQFIFQPPTNTIIKNPELYKIVDVINKDKIDESIFSPSDEKRKIYYSKCIYDKNEHQQLIEEIINDSKDRLKYLGKPFSEKNLSEEIAKRFIFYSPLIKNKNFESEKEWRFVIFLENSFTPEDSKEELEEELETQTCKYLKSKIKQEISQFDENANAFLVNKHLIEFRMGNSFIIPYHKFKFNTNCIAKVTIGACPDSKSVEESTKYFLRQIGFKNADSLVELSKIPYRPW